MISVIVPCYNVEKYVEECLESILMQTYTNFEVICVNDGSTDNTLSILRDYEKMDNRIKVINQKNGGPSNARNNGLLNSNKNAKYVMYIDSDDLLISNDCLEYLVNIMKSIDVDYIQYMLASEDGHIINNIDNSTAINIYSSKEFLEKFDIYFLAADKFLKKDFLISNNISFPENINCSEDWSYTVKCITSAKKICVAHKNVYYYRNTKDSLSKPQVHYMHQHMLDMILGRIRAYMEILFAFADNKVIREKYYNVFKEWVSIDVSNNPSLIYKDLLIKYFGKDILK